ncbi:MAG: diaminopimelate epimerase [Terracidiphilus sp.]
MIPFTKAHACGNDFLIVTEEDAKGLDRAELTRRLCARHTGVGADGIEFFRWTGICAGYIALRNADGSTAEISGNGTRCAAAWMALKMDARAGDEMRIETDAGMRVCRVGRVGANGINTIEISSGMGVPVFTRRTVQFTDGMQIAGAEVSVGNPHFVIVVDNADFSVGGRAWQAIGEEICTHADFPRQTNVEFVRIVNPENIEIRIFERGVGPTMSSGTGTCAAAVAAIGFNSSASPLRVVAPGGAQTVEWAGPGAELKLIGPAAMIAWGEAW